MENQAILKITNCINCPYVDCGYMNEFLGEYEVKKILYSSESVPVPDNCPLLNKN